MGRCTTKTRELYPWSCVGFLVYACGVCIHVYSVYTSHESSVWARVGQGSAGVGGHQEPVRGHPSLDPSPLYFLRQGSLTTWSSPSWLGQLGRCPHTSLLVLSPPPSSEISVCTTYPASLRNKTTQEACYSGPRLYRWHGPVI